MGLSIATYSFNIMHGIEEKEVHSHVVGPIISNIRPTICRIRSNLSEIRDNLDPKSLAYLHHCRNEIGRIIWKDIRRKNCL